MQPFLAPPPPSFLPSLLSLRLRDRQGEREQFGAGLDFQSNIYSALFISLPLEKRSGFRQNSMSGSRRNKTRLPAVRATACFLRSRPPGGSRVSLRARGPGPLFLRRRPWASEQAGEVPGTDQHLLTLPSNYSALQILRSTYRNHVPTRAVTGRVLYLTARVAVQRWAAHVDSEALCCTSFLTSCLRSRRSPSLPWLWHLLFSQQFQPSPLPGRSSKHTGSSLSGSEIARPLHPMQTRGPT